MLTCAGVVLKPRMSAYFFKEFPLVPPFQNLRKCAIQVSLTNLSLWALLEPPLQQSVVLSLHLTRILIRRWCDLRRVMLKPLTWAYLFEEFPLVPLCKRFVITRLCGHFWSRRLQQNVVLCMHFTCILIKRWCDLPRGSFKALKVGLLFWEVSLGKFVITRLSGHF